MLYSAYKHKGLTAVRYPRGAGIGAPEQEQMNEIPFGKGNVVREGSRVAILSFGTLLAAALDAAEKINATVVNMRFVKPLDGVNEYLSAAGINIPTLNLGLPDQYIDHGEQAALIAECGLDAVGIERSIQSSPFYIKATKEKT